MATQMKDIAAHLNISSATVSLALNGKPGVNSETRRKIQDTADKLGYKKTTKKKSAVIEYVLYKKSGSIIFDSPYDSPFFASLLEGILFQAAIMRYEVQVVYIDASSKSSAMQSIHSMKLSRCSGIILLADEMSEEDIHLFHDIDCPIVILDSMLENKLYDSVAIDNVQGGMLAARHLISLGHRDIVFLGALEETNNYKDRYAGFIREIQRSRCFDPGKQYCHSISSVMDQAYTQIKEYIRHSSHLPSGFFCCNDITAMACIHALRDHGFRIPEDVSVIGFDDIATSKLFRPSLSTIHVPSRQLAILAVKRLAELIDSSKEEAVITQLVATSLICRDSTGPARASADPEEIARD